VHVQTAYRNVPQSDAIDALVDSEAQKLDKFFARATGCRVVIERPVGRRARPFSVRIDIMVPGGEIAVTHVPDVHQEATHDPGDEPPKLSKRAEVDAAHKDLQLAVRHAFRKAGRRLQDYARRKRGD
jgi:ribosome-associated translation inhibitor RaiA